MFVWYQQEEIAMSNKINRPTEETSSVPEEETATEETRVPESVVSEIGKNTVRNFDITGKDPIIRNN